MIKKFKKLYILLVFLKKFALPSQKIFSKFQYLLVWKYDIMSLIIYIFY